jgi:transcriptional regulator with XRE-family HTH domain
MEGVGRRTAHLRKQAGIRQLDFARRLRLSPEHTCRIEKGRQKPRLEILFRIAAVLKVPPWRLFMDADAAAGAQRLRGRLSADARKALASAEFVAVAERLAWAYLNAPGKFVALVTVIDNLVGKRSRR